MRESYERVKRAFAAMRKVGYVARSGFMCCRSCAGCKIANDVEEMTEEKRAKVRGVVLTTKQDVDEIETQKKLWISFGPIGTQKFGDVGEDDLTVGQALTKALGEAGVAFEWDGSGSTCVCVDLQATDAMVAADAKVAADALAAAEERVRRERAALLPMQVDVASVVRIILRGRQVGFTGERLTDRERRGLVLSYFAPGDREKVAPVVDAALAEQAGGAS